jgi:hypothetical protein
MLNSIDGGCQRQTEMESLVEYPIHRKRGINYLYNEDKLVKLPMKWNISNLDILENSNFTSNTKICFPVKG